LARANEWARKAEKEVPPAVQAFLDASGQQARRLRLLIVGLGSVPVLVVVGFLALMTYQARQQAKQLFNESVVTDPDSGLMWTRSDNGYDLTWLEADKYCNDLSLAGLSGWRLPKIEDLERLYDPKGGNRYNIRKPFRLSNWLVWSSTEKGSDSAWSFYFNGGRRSSFRMVGSLGYRALCVRRSGE
jgi:Protein of unknown function (DUF1566)